MAWTCWRCGKAPCSHPTHPSHFHLKESPSAHESQRQFSSYIQMMEKLIELQVLRLKGLFCHSERPPVKHQPRNCIHQDTSSPDVWFSRNRNAQQRCCHCTLVSAEAAVPPCLVLDCSHTHKQQREQTARKHPTCHQHYGCHCFRDSKSITSC